VATDTESILHRIRTFKAQSASPVRKEFRPLEQEDFARRTLLCFDQSLSNCGWAILSNEDGHLSVPVSGVIRPPEIEEDGFERTLIKSVYIGDGVDQVVLENLGTFDQVVCEMPAVFGHRTESSLIALVTIVRTMNALELGLPVLVSRQQAAAILCGNKNAFKQESNALVDRLVGERHGKPWNEHVRDAVFVGLRHLT
jgi:Holliday junction resolvasome RuvABC endonuclease subunit